MVSVAQNPLQPVDEAYSSASEEDRQKIRVILVMGLTGTGKSTFIKRLTNDRKIVVGNSLQSRNCISKETHPVINANNPS